MSILNSQTLYSPYLGASPTSNSSFSVHETVPRACGESVNVNFSPGFEDLSVNEEFFSLPIAVQQKYISTLERLRFAQSSHVEESAKWPTHGCSRQTSQPSNICQDSTFPRIFKPESFHLNLQRTHPPKLSLAERRGRRLAHIKSQRLPPQNSQRQNLNPTTPSSALSPQLSLLGKIDIDTFKRDERPKEFTKYRKVVRLDASGLVIQKDSPIYGSDPSLKFEGLLSSLPDCAASPRLKSNMDCNIWHGTKGTAPGTGISTIYDSLIWMENDRDMNLDFTNDDYYISTNKIMASPTNKHHVEPIFPQSVSTNEHRKFARQDGSGLNIHKGSTICGNKPSPTIEMILSSLPDCTANRRQDSNMDGEVCLETNVTDPDVGFSELYDSLNWTEDERDMNLELTLDDYYVNMNKIMASPINKHRAKSTLLRSASTNETSSTDLSSTSPILSPKIDSGSHQLQCRELRYGTRSRARSLATSCLMNKNSTSHQHFFARDSWELMKSEKQVDNYIQATPRSPKPFSTSEVSFGSKESYLTLNFDENDNTLLLDELSLSEMRYFTDDELILSPCHIPTPQRYECPSTPTSTKPVHKQNENSHSGVMKPIVLKKIDSPLASGNKEITLRMTLTRPDLRLDESKIYAWQDSKYPSQIQYSSESIDLLNDKSTIKGPLGGPDGWGPEEREEGVVKRLWNKVTHSRKVP